MYADLGWVSTVGKVGDHLDAHAGLGELHEGLVLVCAHVQLGLHYGPEGRAQLAQLFLGGLIGQVSDVQHLWGRQEERMAK